MKRAIIYARVSTDKQADEGLSIDSQIDACRRKAEQLGAVVLHVFRDEGISGTTDARPGFRTAINRCAIGDIDYMICWSSSRFARDQHDAISYKRELVSYRTKLSYAQSQIDLSSHEGWMLDSFQQVVDESYSRQVSADTKRSMMRAASEGYFMGGRPPYGYQADLADDQRRRRLVPHEAEAAVIKMIFEQSSHGTGAYLIARQLNNDGFSSRSGRPWHKGTILHILQSEVYMGIVIYNRMDRKGKRERPEEDWIRVQAHEPIITAELFHLVRDGLSDRTPQADRSAPNSGHIFTGLLRCGHCNSSLQIATGTGRSKTYSYYACRGDLQGSKCSFKRTRADLLDRWLLGELLDKLLNRDVIQGVLDGLDEAAGRWVKDRAAKRTTLVLEMRTLESRRDKLYDAIETGGAGTPGITELGPRLRKIAEQLAKIEASLMTLENETEPMAGDIGVTADEAAEVFRTTIEGSSDPKTLRAFVATIAQMIVVKDTEVVVHYKPECLVMGDGEAVQSKHRWLPVSSTLRTAILCIGRGDSPMGGERRMRLAA